MVCDKVPEPHRVQSAVARRGRFIITNLFLKKLLLRAKVRTSSMERTRVGSQDALMARFRPDRTKAHDRLNVCAYMPGASISSLSENSVLNQTLEQNSRYMHTFSNSRCPRVRLQERVDSLPLTALTFLTMKHN